MADFQDQKSQKSYVQNLGIFCGGSGHGPESSGQISAYYKFFWGFNVFSISTGLKEQINMIESVVFHRLITDFEEKSLRVDDSEESCRVRLYQDEAGVQAVEHLQRKVEPRGENISLRNMDLSIGATTSKRRPATFSQFFFSWTPICFFLSSALRTS